MSDSKENMTVRKCTCGERIKVDANAVAYYCPTCQVTKMVSSEEIDFIDDMQRKQFSKDLKS